MKNCTRCGYENQDDAIRCKNCKEELSANDNLPSLDLEILKRKSDYSSGDFKERSTFSWGTFFVGLLLPLYGFFFIASRGQLFNLVIMIDIVFCITLAACGKSSKGLSAFFGLLIFWGIHLYYCCI